MSDKYRSISLVVAVLIFLAGNIIAGYYKWGASSETPDRQVLLKDTAEDIGNQKKHNNKLTNELNSLKNRRRWKKPLPVKRMRIMWVRDLKPK